MSMDTDNHGFEAGDGDSDRLANLLVKTRPAVEPISRERSQQVFQSALRESGVTRRRPAYFGMRFWLAASLPAGALAGAVMLALLTHKSPEPPSRRQSPPKYVNTDLYHSGVNVPVKVQKSTSVPAVAEAARVVDKIVPVSVVKHHRRRRMASTAASNPPSTARVEFVQNDMLISRFAENPAIEVQYVPVDGQPAPREAVALQSDTANNALRVQPVKFSVRISQGNVSGFAKASTITLDDSGQLRHEYCTVANDNETQNFTSTTTIGNREAGEGLLALTVKFTVASSLKKGDK